MCHILPKQYSGTSFCKPSTVYNLLQFLESILPNQNVSITQLLYNHTPVVAFLIRQTVREGFNSNFVV